MRPITTVTAGGRMPRAERRAQLLTAASAAFVRGGFDGTSMEDVAEAAGVTRLIVYRIFATKELLYRAVLESVTERLTEEFGRASGARGEVPTGAAVERGGVAAILLAIARERPDAFRLLWRHAVHEPLFAEEAQEFRELSASFADALIHPYVHDRVVRRGAATTVVAHLYDATCNWLDLGDPDRDDEYTARVREGLRGLVDAWATPRTSPPTSSSSSSSTSSSSTRR
jgi:AcrR family transcriptional regulator